MSWAEDLPRISAENKAWHDKYVPRLRAEEQERRAERTKVVGLLYAASEGWSQTDRAAVGRITGLW